MNTLVKKMFALAAIAFAAGTVKAADSYLYWMVDATQNDIQFSYATVKEDGATGYLNLYDGETNLLDYRLGATTDGFGTGAAYFGTFTASSDMSFIMELWLASEVVGRKTVGYSDLLGSIFTDNNKSGATAYAASGFEAVPEPTSGLLALFGLAALALRRRKRA